MYTTDLHSRGLGRTGQERPLFTARRRRPLALGLAACLMSGLLMAVDCFPTGDTGDTGDETTPPVVTQVTLRTNLGDMVIELYPEQAPQAVAKFLELVNDQGYYDGKIFHDANTSFLVAGAYSVTLEDGEEITTINESNNGMKNTRGRVAFYGPTSETSVKPQFLINLTSNTSLDYTLGSTQRPAYTVIGRVVQGMDIADDIAALQRTSGTSSGGDSLSRIPQTSDGHKVRIIAMSSEADDLGENTAPVAVATAPATVEPKAKITLNGSGSYDPDGDPLTYEWALAAETQQGLETLGLTVTIAKADQANAELTAPSPSSPVLIGVELKVTDDRGASNTTTVVITLGDNIAPVANAGADKTGHPGDTVQLDGSASSDPDSETALTYAWSMTAESQQLLTSRGLPIPPGGTAAKYSFVAPLVTSPTPLTFQLKVTDSKGAEATDTVDVRILPIAFDAAVSYTVGGSLTAIAVGDFNADSKPDVAVTNSATNEVAVLLNDGEGALLPAVTYAVGTSPESLVVADLNGDGQPDIAAANRTSNTASVLINSGTGTFAAAVTFNMGFGPVSLAAADFDGISGIDLAAVNTTAAGDNSLAVLTNDSQGGFAAGNSDLVITGKVDDNTITPAGAQVLAAGKIDSGNLADLAVAYADRKVFILLGDTSKTEGFRYASHFDAGPAGANNPRGITLADVSGDSQLDVAVTLNAINKVAVRRNAGSGQFAFEALYDTGAGPVGVVGADLDGDNDVDLAIANENANTVSVLQNKGTGSFKDKVDLELDPQDMGPVAVVAADFNGDGAKDLAVVNKTSGTVSILAGLSIAAEAGDDQNVLVNEMVTLRGEGRSSRKAATFSYRWTQTAGPTVTLSSPNVAQPTFTAPSATCQLVFSLTVTDDQNATATDSVIVDVFIQTDSGLKYSDTVVGTGALVTPTSTVSVLYTGKIDNRAGNTFDTTEPGDQPREFSLSGLIVGWQEGLGHYDMRVGGRRILIIPPALGYGSQSKPNIPANSTLWFDIEVLDAD